MAAKTINTATRVYKRRVTHTERKQQQLLQNGNEQITSKPNNNQKQYRMCQTIHMVIVYAPPHPSRDNSLHYTCVCKSISP